MNFPHVLAINFNDLSWLNDSVYCDYCNAGLPLAELTKQCAGEGWEKQGWSLFAFPLNSPLSDGTMNRTVFTVTHCEKCTPFVRRAIERGRQQHLREQANKNA